MKACAFSCHDIPPFQTVLFFTPNSKCHLASLGPNQTSIIYVPLASALCFCLKFSFCFTTPCQQLFFTWGWRSCLACCTGWDWLSKMERWAGKPISNSWTSFLLQAMCLIPWARCIFILAGIVAALRTAADSIPYISKEHFPSHWQQQFQPWQACFQL